MNFEREIKFTPAYDKRPKYGIHGVNLRMLLKQGNRAVQFVLYTNWMLPHVEKELDDKPHGGRPHLFCHPQPADLGYHSPVPLYEGCTPMGDVCEITGGDCYYDGSGLNAERIYKVLVAEGDEGVWRELEAYFVRIFGEVAA